MRLRYLVGTAVALLIAPVLVFSPAQAPAAAAASNPQFSQPCGNPGTPGQVHHIIWIWMENESYSSIIDNANAPYQTSLAHQCGLPTNFHNESHDSLDNYIAATDGQNILGTSFLNDCLPNLSANSCVSSGPSIFSQTEAAGESWRGYAEDMPTTCNRTNTGNYVARHNPAVYYSTLTSCAQYDIPMGDATTQTGAFYDDVRNGNLPSFSFIAPNLNDDAHNSSASVGDTWLSNLIPFITSNPNYQAGDTDIFITNDEGAGSDYALGEDCTNQTLDASQPSCHIPTIVVAPYIPSGTVDSSFYTHYSMLRTAEELLGLPLLGLAGSANSMVTSFNLGPVNSTTVPPSAPTNLTATANSSSQVTLSWGAATAGSLPISGYQISRNGTLLTTVTGTSYSDTAVTPGTTYSYNVTAVDTNGSTGPASNPATVTTPGAMNLLANPGFETWAAGGPTGWTTYGPATTLTQSSDAHSGSSSVQIATTSAGYAASGINDGSKATVSSTLPAVTYTASCWAKISKTPTTVNIELHEAKQNGTSVTTAAETSFAPPTTTGWYQIQVSDTTVGTGDKLPMSVFSTNTKAGGATFEVDDCSLSTATAAPPPDTTAPTSPTNLVATPSSSTQVGLSWTAATDNVGVTGYQILRNGVVVGTTAGASTTFADTGLSASTAYSYTVTAFDAAGNVSPPSAAATVTTPPPPVAPAAPTNLTATAISPTQVSLSWTAATAGSSPITGYDVFRDGTLISGGITSTSFSDSGLLGSTTYSYTVTAIDANNLASPASVAATATTPAPIPPSSVTNLTATAVSSSQTSLTWTAATPGSSPIAGYQVARDGTVVATVNGTSYTDTGLSANTEYDYTVTTVDELGATSPPSADAVATTLPAPTPPAAPTNLAGSASSPTQVALSWTAAVAGTAPIAEYLVVRNGTQIGTAATTSYVDTTAAASTTYSYSVVALDGNGLTSPASASVNVTTPAATTVNLLTNPGFETWSAGMPAVWTTYGPATTLTQSSDAHSGASSIQVATSSASYAASGINDGPNSKPTISSTVAGVTYTASCWAKVSKVAVTINVSLHEEKQNGTSVNAAAVGSITPPSTSTWYQVQVSYTTTGAGDKVPMSIYSTNTKSGGATFKLDDCSLSRAM